VTLRCVCWFYRPGLPRFCVHTTFMPLLRFYAVCAPTPYTAAVYRLSLKFATPHAHVLRLIFGRPLVTLLRYAHLHARRAFFVDADQFCITHIPYATLHFTVAWQYHTFATFTRLPLHTLLISTVLTYIAGWLHTAPLYLLPFWFGLLVICPTHRYGFVALVHAFYRYRSASFGYRRPLRYTFAFLPHSFTGPFNALAVAVSHGFFVTHFGCTRRLPGSAFVIRSDPGYVVPV